MVDTKGIVSDKLDIKQNLEGKRDRVEKVQLDKSDRLASIGEMKTAEDLVEFMAQYSEESSKINDKDNSEIMKLMAAQLETVTVETNEEAFDLMQHWINMLGQLERISSASMYHTRLDVPKQVLDHLSQD